MFHLLTHDDMNIIMDYGANLSIQSWVIARYLEAASFIAAFLLFKKGVNGVHVIARIRSRQIFFIYALIFIASMASILAFNIFQSAAVTGIGMAHFKAYNEYIISAIFFGSIILLFKKRKIFDREVANLLSLSLIMKVIAEVLFAKYGGVNCFADILGNILFFISFLLLYKAVIEGGLMRPYRFLFLDLKKSEKRYRSLVEFSPDAIVVHSDGKILYANGPAKKLFGIEEDEKLIGAELTDFFGPEYRERIRLRIKNIFSGKWKEAPTTEMEILHANGRTISVEVKGMKIIYEGKEAIESIIRDVSERKLTEEKIRSLARFPEEDPSPVIRVLGDGQVQYANRPARRMLLHLGWSEGRVLPEILFLPVRQVLEKGIKQEVEVTCVCGRVFAIMFAPSLTENWVNLYGREITKRKIMEKELIETQAELRKKIEEQLVESYKHLGLVNRKISLLLELDSHSQDKKNKHEIVEYILNSLINLSHAKAGLLYLAIGKNHFNLISSAGLKKEKLSGVQVVTESSADFMRQLTSAGKRVNGSCELVNPGLFNIESTFSYFVALPILAGNICKGFLFLGFNDRKSMDVQELEFLDVFAKHVSSALTNSGFLN